MSEAPNEQTQAAPQIMRQEFGAKELVRQGETTAVAVAATARALVEARYVMALQRPRDIDQVRVDILKHCKRPRFAEKAKWRRPVGDGKSAEGPSIRFTEAAALCMGNIDNSVAIVFDDQLKRIVRVAVTDLEKNVPYQADVTVEKTVERKSLKPGQVPLGSRINSYGQRVFVVEADEGALLVKQNAQVSKALRVLQLRVIPADLVEEAMDAVHETLKAEDRADPEAAKKKLIDSFTDVGVTPDRLKAFLGHPVAEITPAERDNLRAIYTAIKDGETTWAEVVDAANKTESTAATGPDEHAHGSEAAATKTEKMAEKLRTKKNSGTHAAGDVPPDASTTSEPPAAASGGVDGAAASASPAAITPAQPSDVRGALATNLVVARDHVFARLADGDRFVAGKSDGKWKTLDDLVQKGSTEEISGMLREINSFADQREALR